MVKRTLTGSLGQVSPPVLLRLLAATSPSGVLELSTDAGALRLEVSRGAVAMPTDEELHHAGAVLRSRHGRFRFEPCELRPPDGPSLPLLELEDAAERAPSGGRTSPSEADVPTPAPSSRPPIHVLAPSSGGNPLDELLAELEENAPDELLLAQIGVVATDPRLWHGTLEATWRRRGWNVRLHGDPATADIDGCDLLVVHHQRSVTRAGREDQWLDVVRRAAAASPPVPVIWIGPLADAGWIYRLLETGVRTVLPPPGADHGDTVVRFSAVLETVVERELGTASVDHGMAGGIGDLIDAVLRDADPDEAAGALLQLVAGRVARAAVLLVEERAIRCRAGFGYPLERGRSVLPRGLGLLERVTRSRRAVTGVEPGAAGAVELARALGVDRLPAETAVIPLGSPTGVSGLLVVDRHGDPLPDLHEIVLVGERLGGVVVARSPDRDGTGPLE